MHKVGDPIDGYCSKCRRNVFMSLAATDGREIFSVVCRTCQTTQPYKPEASAEALREQAFKKLQRAASRRRKVSVSRGPEIVARGRRPDGELDAPRPAPAPAAAPAADAAPVASAPPRRRISSVEAPTPSRRRSGASAMPLTLPTRKEEVLPPPAPVSDVTATWREKTANLGPRDGKVYYADRTYGIGDVLLHKRYGMGIVESVVHDTAIMVLFRDGQQVIEMAAGS